MPPTRRHLEEELVTYSQRLHSEGWVANHDGNVTVKLADGRLLATPTGISKASVDRQSLIVVNDEGKVVSGRLMPFSELGLHLYVYRERPDVRAVIHSHAPHATALAVAGVEVVASMLPEPVVSLGERIPLIPYAPPKSPESTLNLAAAVPESDAVTLESHGVLTWGPDLETAYLRMELVEHLARIQLLAMQAGQVRTISTDDIERLLKARTKAGLGLTARMQQTQETQLPTDRAEPQTTEEVKAVVRQEVSRAVR